MDTRLPDEVRDFARAAKDRFAGLGAVDLARAAEADRGARQVVPGALADLGVADLDVRADGDQLLAGAALCRAAGRVALPWPVVSELLRVDGARTVLIDAADPRVDHGDLPGDWLGLGLDQTAHRLHPGEPGARLLAPFLVRATCGEAVVADVAADVDRHLVLGAWVVLGALEEAVAQVSQHLRSRQQFGKPLAEFQSVRFAVADLAVGVRGFEELACYTLWRQPDLPAAERRADALAARLYAVDTARATLRTAHQLYGALGFCDETDLSILDRHLQPTLRLPVAAERLAGLLAGAVSSGDLVGLGA